MAQSIQWKQYTSIVYKELPALPREKPESYHILSHNFPPKKVLPIQLSTSRTRQQ